jgi:serine/threonine protein kinase
VITPRAIPREDPLPPTVPVQVQHVVPVPSGSDLEPAPAALNGRYTIGEVIGRGGMATVHVADDALLNRRVAIKLFHNRAGSEAELRLQEAEARVIAGLNHYALTTLFDVGVDGRDPRNPRIFLVMEHVDGSDLKRRLRAGGPIAPAQVCWLGFDLAEALEQVHHAGFLHRDVKPANVLLFPEEPGRRLRGKLADFGIASIIGRPEQSQYTTGTAAYLSPEQVEGRDAVAASDVYALGLVLLEALTGRVAFPGSITESAFARLERDPEIPASVPAPIADAIRGMTARRAEDRISLHEAGFRFQSYLVDELVELRTLDPALLAPDESQRVSALRRYDVLDTPPDATFDAITRLAGRMLQVPIALITLIDMDRVWFKSKQGWDADQVDRDVSFCATTNPGTGTPWSIPDAQADERTRSNPLVTAGPEVRAYAGAPLITHDGHTLGALCVFDREARPFTEVELENLKDLASLVMHEMELRLATRRAVLDR